MEEEEVALVQLRTNLSFANSRCTEPSSCTLGGSVLFLTTAVRHASPVYLQIGISNSGSWCDS